MPGNVCEVVVGIRGDDGSVTHVRLGDRAVGLLAPLLGEFVKDSGLTTPLFCGMVVPASIPMSAEKIIQLPGEVEAAPPVRTPILRDLDGWQAREIAKRRRDWQSRKAILERIITDCGWTKIPGPDTGPAEFSAWLNKQPNPGRTLNKFQSTLSAFVKYVRMVRPQEMPFNWVRAMERHDETDATDGMRWLTKDEWRKLDDWVAANCPKRLTPYRVFAFTGMRWDDVRSLTPSQIKVDKGVPRFELPRRTKEKKVRSIPITDEWMLDWARGVAKAGGDAPIFHRKNPVPSLKTLRKDAVSAGLSATKEIGYHSFRKLFASQGAADGIPLQTMQKMLGHASPTTTARFYTDLETSAAAEHMKKSTLSGKKHVDIESENRLNGSASTPMVTNHIQPEAQIPERSAAGGTRYIPGVERPESASLDEVGCFTKASLYRSELKWHDLAGVYPQNAAIVSVVGEDGGDNHNQGLNHEDHDERSGLSVCDAPVLHGSGISPVGQPVECHRGVHRLAGSAGSIVPVDRTGAPSEPRGGCAVGGAPASVAGDGQSGTPGVGMTVSGESPPGGSDSPSPRVDVAASGHSVGAGRSPGSSATYPKGGIDPCGVDEHASVNAYRRRVEQEATATAGTQSGHGSELQQAPRGGELDPEVRQLVERPLAQPVHSDWLGRGCVAGSSPALGITGASTPHSEEVPYVTLIGHTNTRTRHGDFIKDSDSHVSPRPVDAGHAGHSPSPLPISPANAAPVGFTPPPGGPSATSRSPAFSDLELARVMVDRASDYNLQGKAKAMKYAMRAAAALLLAGASAVGWQPVMMGYATGKDCYFGSGAYLAPTVGDCIGMCQSACPQLLTDCALGCAGGYTTDAMIEAMWTAQSSIRSHAGDTARNVAVIELGMHHPDERVRIIATALGAETPFVSLKHSEQGDI